MVAVLWPCVLSPYNTQMALGAWVGCYSLMGAADIRLGRLVSLVWLLFLYQGRHMVDSSTRFYTCVAQPEEAAPIWNLRGVNCNSWHRVTVNVE